MSKKLIRPLEGVVVLDFSQFLAGPVAALRLADLGARVIKIERPGTGDIGRTLAFAGRTADGDTVSFHAMNRNKESVTADLKNPEDLDAVKNLIAQADVIIQNFRPGVMERIGLDYKSISELYPRIIYASATGYGNEGPWKDRPGQDLLAQAISGISWLSGSFGDGPVPVGVSIADHLMSCHIAQGVTSLLLRRERTGEGGHIETSLLEGLLDLQFELLTTHLNDSSVTVERQGKNSANAFLAAPYGTYPTKDGFIALAMNPIPKIGALLNIPELIDMTDPALAWQKETEIAKFLTATFEQETTTHWLTILDAADVWCAPVLTLEELIAHDGFNALEMTQQVTRNKSETQNGRKFSLHTTRSPIRIDGQTLTSEKPAPKLGQHNKLINGGIR